MRANSLRMAGTGPMPMIARIDAGRRPADDARQRLDARAPRAAAALISTSAAPPSVIPDDVPAVIDARLSLDVAEHRRQLRAASRSSCPAADARRRRRRVAASGPSHPVDRHRRDLVAEAAGGDRRAGAPLRLERVGVRLLARDPVLPREHLRRLAHDHAAERAGEAVAVHRVDEREVAPSCGPSAHLPRRSDTACGSSTRCRRRRRPRTRRAGSTARRVAIACMPDAHALLIVCAGTLSGSPARRTTCRAGLGPDPACRAWPMSTSSTRRRSDARALERRPGGDRAELGRVDVPERPAVAADRRARRADNHDLRTAP